MKKVILILMMCLLVGCSSYHEKDFLGKTSIEIVNEFGEFDCTLMPMSEDGYYRNCRCGYSINHSKTEIYFITFDEFGVAIACEKGVRPGG